MHEKHRERLKGRFLKEGLDNFDELYVLEMLLFYCVPRKDTNELAHKLLDRFGNLNKVIRAPKEELEKVEGVGPGISTFLSFLLQLNRYCSIKAVDQDVILNNTQACCDYIRPYFIGKNKETVYLICLDNKCKVIECRMLCEGSVNSVALSVRRIVEVAMATNAASVILAHNHPDGVMLPSAEDIATTEHIYRVLNDVGVTLADHIVCAERNVCSMVSGNYFKPGRKD